MIKSVLGYHFKNPNLLDEALTHPSMHKKKSHNSLIYNYERLEFLGDAVLSMLIAELLLKKFPEEDEGQLAKRRASLVSGEILARIAANEGLSELIIMTDAEQKLGGRKNSNNLENVLEALIGAIYLDSELTTIKQIISDLWTPFIDQIYETPTDYKSQLQEIVQQYSRELPKYELIDAYGPQHMLTFKVRLTISNYEAVIAEGKSKQQAEKNAAKLLLQQITLRENTK